MLKALKWKWDDRRGGLVSARVLRLGEAAEETVALGGGARGWRLWGYGVSWGRGLWGRVGMGVWKRGGGEGVGG